MLNLIKIDNLKEDLKLKQKEITDHILELDKKNYDINDSLQLSELLDQYFTKLAYINMYISYNTYADQDVNLLNEKDFLEDVNLEYIRDVLKDLLIFDKSFVKIYSEIFYTIYNDLVVECRKDRIKWLHFLENKKWVYAFKK